MAVYEGEPRNPILTWLSIVFHHLLVVNLYSVLRANLAVLGSTNRSGLETRVLYDIAPRNPILTVLSIVFHLFDGSISNPILF